MSAGPDSSSSPIDVANEFNENDSVCVDSKDCEDMLVDVTSVQHTPVWPKKHKLQLWLNKNLRIEMTDGRVLIGVFLCTDRDSNIILGSCSEYLTTPGEDGRILGLVMIPGRHIVSIQIESASLETT